MSNSSALKGLRIALFLALLISSNLILVSAQDKVYPNMPFRVYRLNNGLVMGFEAQAGLGPEISNDPISGKFAGLNLLAGYQLTRSLVVSAGAGLSFYKNSMLIPLFLDFRYAIALKKLSPYFYADGGLLLKTDISENTKVFINPGFGVQYSLSHDFAFVVSSGFWLQRGEVKLNSFAVIRAGVKYKF